MQFVCDLCRQHYSTFEILMTHNRLRHYHTIKFGCGYCNETFRNEDDLYCHFVLTHHVDPHEGRGPAADRPRNASESEDGEGGDELMSPVVRRADETCPQMRLISESEDGSEYEADEDEEDGSDSVDSDLELNYNELYMRRKRSAMTQEEISELADVFKKTVQATYTTKYTF
ncbi:transcriptional regulator of yeast form adherence 4-like isoform X2 [Anopheles albimanus]|uniref:transcriptional regulator of yeast form adherence 4-like isoform X2 n=1 Tax=Anopheles albimanus TaxID=7167 RepID=UPI00163FF03B|nr:transcriptional regulator of yeast form adherence 4-like isoform X2 [Anopheles albimanus]